MKINYDHFLKLHIFKYLNLVFWLSILTGHILVETVPTSFNKTMQTIQHAMKKNTHKLINFNGHKIYNRGTTFEILVNTVTLAEVSTRFDQPTTRCPNALCQFCQIVQNKKISESGQFIFTITPCNKVRFLILKTNLGPLKDV